MSGIFSEQIQDGQVKRQDLNKLSPGESVIASIISGEETEIESTGADTGTGDVTIKATIFSHDKIPSGETVRVRENRQMVVGALELDGFLDLEGSVFFAD
jgi:hypothetical protein